MKNLFITLGAFLSLQVFLPSVSMAQTNLITNGDFERQYPGITLTKELNIKGDRSYYVDELPSWLVPSAGSGPSPVVINATFLATNTPNAAVNPTSNTHTFAGPFLPHNNSVGCVGLKRSVFYPAYDGLITQQVTLIPGHRYQFSYYVMKRPGSGYASKFAFNVINSNSTPALSANNATSSFQPTPAIPITTDFLTSTNWTYVTGSFTAQTPPVNTKSWIVVGYDRSSEQIDPNAGGNTNGNEVYIIDDVSLIEMAVPACPYDLILTAATADGPVQPDGNGGGVATPDNAAAGDVPVNTPVTMTVNGNGIGACIWNVYASTGNGSSSYTSSTNGTQFSITPHQPSSAKAPNGSDNYAQSYSITCTVSSTTCPQGVSLQYTLYSNPPAGGGGGGGGGEFDPQLSQTQSQPQIATYPNPAVERILVTVPANQNAQAALYNQYGELKANLPVTGILELPIRQLQPGIYYLKVKTSSGQLVQKRIAIQH